MARRPSLPSLPSLPPSARRRPPSRRILERRGVADRLVSVAGLVGRPVTNPLGGEVGRLVDAVARWDGGAYPPITGIVVRIGRRLTFVPASQIESLSHREVRLQSARLDLVDFERREGEVVLAGDVIDHQLVDVDGVRVVRAADLYLASITGRWRLVGVDVSAATLLRRLGPARLRGRLTPDRVIDWDAVQPFGRPGNPLRLRDANNALRRLRPDELADLLEELGRTQRQELLAALDPESAADALEEMEPAELESLLRQSDPDHAAALLSIMEPDEAADALRDLPDEEQRELLDAMAPATAERLAVLVGYEEGTAGGVMTTLLVTVTPTASVASVIEQLRGESDHPAELDAVLVVDDAGALVDDVTLLELLLADPEAPVGDLVREPWPVTVAPDASLRVVVEQFRRSRGTSLVVVDEERRPVGRILADDLIDALAPTLGRFHFRPLRS